MNNESPPPHMQLAIMSRGYVVSRAIHAIAHLGIADHMSEHPVSVKELAELSSTIPDLLDRLLTFLSDYGVFLKTENGYALTPLSYPLRQDHPFSMKDVLGMFDESWWQAFAHLETTLKTKTPGFEQQQGIDFFNYLKNNPDYKNRFDSGMSKLSSFDNDTLIKSFDYSKFHHIIDIGNGSDSLVIALNAQYPSLRADTYQFQPELAQHHAKDLFALLPTADAFILKGILHDFSSEAIRQILIELHKKMDSSSSLIIAEQAIPETNTPHTNKTMDIVMMVLVGGQQRTLNNWRELVESVGFTLKSNTPTKGLFTVMEFQISGKP